VDAARDTRRAALLSVASNTVLAGAKLVVGLVTGSVAVLSEAAHSTGDLVASVIAFAAVRTAARPADRDHPYGHERAENVAAGVEGALVLAAGGFVAYEAVQRLAHGGSVSHLGWAIGVMAASSLVSACVALRLRRVARRTGSPALEGDALHLSTDAATSVAVVAGLVLVGVTGWQPLDALVALAVCSWTLWLGARLAWRSVQVLVDLGLTDAEMSAVQARLSTFAVDGVSFHALRGRRAGAKRHVDLHMVVPPETTVRAGHALSGRVKTAIVEALPGAEVLIHLEDHGPGEGAEPVQDAQTAMGTGIVEVRRGW
jgi:cation diffusion facilitator family transporter